MARRMKKFDTCVCNFLAGIINDLENRLTIQDDDEDDTALVQSIAKNIEMLKTNVNTLSCWSMSSNFYSNLEPIGLPGVRYVNTVLGSTRRARGVFVGAKWRIKAYCAMKQYHNAVNSVRKFTKIH